MARIEYDGMTLWKLKADGLPYLLSGSKLMCTFLNSTTIRFYAGFSRLPVHDDVVFILSDVKQIDPAITFRTNLQDIEKAPNYAREQSSRR